MKKFLSLVLALVMTMSLVTVSAGAKDFSDNSKITYKEAVDVMSAAKVIDGYADGTFNPSTTLTRGAAAKIICNMILGPTTAGALVADAAPYKDVPVNHTFAGYIAYCQKEGIINGYADGTFKPANPLNGYAFMKMLLGALGYDGKIEGYTGSNWSINVAKRALNIGLDDDLTGDFNGVKAVTREEACLYALNTMKANMVEYDSTTNISVGGAQVVIAGSKAKDVELSNNDSRDGKIYRADNVMQFAEKYFDKLSVRTVRDDFGRPSNKWVYDKKEVGTYKETADQVYYKNVKAKDICKDLDLDKADYYSYSVVVDGNDTYGSLVIDKNNDKKISKVTGSPIVGNGSLVEVYKDQRVITVVNEYLMQVAGDYNTSKKELTLAAITDVTAPVLILNNSGKLDADDYTGLDSFKDEDYVLVTAYKDGANYTVDTIQAAPTAVATVSDYVTDDTVTAGDTTYKYGATATDEVKTFAYTLKDEYTLYLNTQGQVIYADGVTADDDVVFVTEFYTSGDGSRATRMAYAYFLDGTAKGIELNKVGSSKAKDLKVGGTSGEYTSKLGSYVTGWYKYSLKADGTYDLKTVAHTTHRTAAANVVDYSNSKTAIYDGTTTYRGNADTKFVVVKPNDDVVTYTGIKNVDKITATAGSHIAVIYDGAYAKQVFVDLADGSSVKGNSSNGDVIFVTDSDYKVGRDVDDDEYYRYDALVNGVETTIKTDSVALTAGVAYGNVTYTSDKKYLDGAKSYINDSNVLDTTEFDNDDAIVFVGALGGNVTLKKQTLNLASGASFYMADNAKVFVYTSGSNDFDTYTASQFAVNYKTSKAYAQVVGILNADGEVSALYVKI